jgi:tight adherence protein B
MPSCEILVPLAAALAEVPDAGYRAAITVLAMVAGFAGVLGLRPRMAALVERREARFHEALVELFLFDVTPRQVTVLMFIGCGVAGMVLAMVALNAGVGPFGLFGAFLVGAVGGYFVADLVLAVLQRRRRNRLNEQLIDGLVTLANGLRAGLNLVQSMKLIETNGQPPLSQEFGLMLREFEHGTSLDDVLRRASRRLKIHNYKLLFAAMETARQRGGNLAATLDRLSESLREILRLEEKVKALTAENRMSARIMGLMPLAILVVFYMIDESWVGVLFSTDWGFILLIVAGVLNLAGFLWIRKIVTFEI